MGTMRSTFPGVSYPACGDDRMYDLHHGLLVERRQATQSSFRSPSSPITSSIHQVTLPASHDR
jgi:hypothetical protein